MADRVREKPITVTLLNDHKFRKQIVQSLDSENTDLKEDAFLSDKTRSFDRQRVAKNIDIFTKPLQKSGKRGGRQKIKMSDLGSLVKTDPFREGAKDYSQDKDGDGGDSPIRKMSSTNDYVEDIPLGDVTTLNTVEYKYYGFYFRIRQKLEQFWGRSIQEKAQELASSGRRVPASENLITALVVVLNPSGSIIDIYLKGSSGIKELDDAAIEAFNEAGPFPNPPKDLVRNGKVTIEWGFVVSS